MLNSSEKPDAKHKSLMWSFWRRQSKRAKDDPEEADQSESRENGREYTSSILTGVTLVNDIKCPRDSKQIASILDDKLCNTNNIILKKGNYLLSC